MSKLEAQLIKFTKALDSLRAVLKMEKTEIVRDSAIQRFEFCLDLGWKCLKTYLEEQKGVVARSPKESFKLAFENNIVPYDEYWLTMVDLRNETVHTYEESIAEKVFSELPKCMDFLGNLKTAISK